MRQWVQVDMKVLRDARKAKGLSYEATSRLLNCSAKTYERYEKNGRVPIDLVDRVAAVLDLEIERPGFVPGTITVPAGLDPVDLPAELAELVVRLERVAERLEDAQRPPTRGERRSA